MILKYKQFEANKLDPYDEEMWDEVQEEEEEDDMDGFKKIEKIRKKRYVATKNPISGDHFLVPRIMTKEIAELEDGSEVDVTYTKLVQKGDDLYVPNLRF